jgi:hypothetical protein
MGNFCFLSGVLLADLSLILRTSPLTTDNPLRYYGRRWQRLFIEHWPTALAMFALFLASVPPADQDYAAYSRVICSFFKKYISPERGKFSCLLFYTDIVLF